MASDPTLASIWSLPRSPSHPRLTGSLDVEVAVVGGGIAGLTTAALLAEAGVSVCVLEARRIGSGTSGRTTAKASALQGERYAPIARIHGAEAARRYADSQVDALRWLRERVARREVACDWRDQPNRLHATTPEGRARLEAERDAATAAGLDVRWRDEADLPFPTTGALELVGQGAFDPGPHLADLAAQVAATPGCSVFEQTRVTGVGGWRAPVVRAEGGEVRAQQVVVATLLPILDRGLFFARAKPRSSYLVALRATGALPTAMELSVDEPTRSLRTAADADGELLVVGGEGHDTGRGAPTGPRYHALEGWARLHFPVGETVARWSAHDYVPADHLPWVGPSSRLTPQVLVATGFEKWGMTAGTAAALALADRILGRADGPSAGWASLFRSDRLAAEGVRTAVQVNATVAGRMAADWARPERGASEGTGRRRRRGLVPVGSASGVGSGDAEVSVVCTHLGGVCEWNDADATWDCPLHGSRFEATGEVLAGPATRPLRACGGAADR